jgi:hypothetical protein
MSDLSERCEVILNNFLMNWPVEKVANMPLSEYVSTNNHNTFCYWVEIKAIDLGNIRGYNSSKFGIYKRKNVNKKPKRLFSDNEYSWQKHYGDTKTTAFDNVKTEIIQIINFAKNGELSRIDDIKLNPLTKWKIAFLYSDELLVPIYKREVLENIAKDLGNKINKKTPYSDLYKIIINNKPPHLNVFEYSDDLYRKYSRLSSTESATTKGIRKSKRKGTDSKNTNDQERKGGKKVVVKQFHNLLQQNLYDWLVKKHGISSVIMEENHVDIKLKKDDEIIFYEVKSNAHAADCIKAALGQVLAYTFGDPELKNKEIIIAGPNPLKSNEISFVDYIKKQLKIKFSYISINETVTK